MRRCNSLADRPQNKISLTNTFMGYREIAELNNIIAVQYYIEIDVARALFDSFDSAETVLYSL